MSLSSSELDRPVTQIARRISAGKYVVLADLRQEAADVSTATVDVSSRAVGTRACHGIRRSDS